MIIKNFIEKIQYWKACRSSSNFLKYMRSKGIAVGEGCVVPAPKTVSIDFTRPSLISIGNNVRINKDMTIMTHDYASVVFLNKYNEFINSSGKITIGNNVYFGRHVTVLKGVSIGDNCIIGYGSLVMKDIPDNSVAAGTPAKVICSLDEYYEKRKKKAKLEAFEYARSIVERCGRKPIPSDFFEEFPYFVDGSNMDDYPSIPVKHQLGPSLNEWKKNHVAEFESFEDFLKSAGIG